MLPLNNSTFYPDDLEENAIQFGVKMMGFLIIVIIFYFMQKVLTLGMMKV